MWKKHVQYEYTYNSLHQLTTLTYEDTTVRFSYDELGNLIHQWTDTDNDGVMDDNEDRKVFTWSLLGQLSLVEVYTGSVQSASVEYAYHNELTGQLKSRIVNGITTTTYHWEGFNLYLEEENGNAKYAYFNRPSLLGGAVARYTLGANHRLDASDEVIYFYHDGAGNLATITNATGEIIHRFEQDAWGNDLNDTFENDYEIFHHCSGKLLDPITGLYYNQIRWYDPTIGRFISESPIAPLSGEEYAYCHNDPVNFADVDGEIAFLVIIGGAWAVIEFGLSIYDIYDTVTTVINPCESLINKIISGGGFVIGILLPGGGYGPLARESIEHIDDVWKLAPFVRGNRIEKTLGANLPHTFPVIDRFENGIATSIKSMNINDKTYLNPENIRRVGERYIDSVSNIQGARLKNIKVTADVITSRALDLAVPSGANAAQ